MTENITNIRKNDFHLFLEIWSRNEILSMKEKRRRSF